MHDGRIAGSVTTGSSIATGSSAAIGVSYMGASVSSATDAVSSSVGTLIVAVPPFARSSSIWLVLSEPQAARVNTATLQRVSGILLVMQLSFIVLSRELLFS